MVWLAIFGLGHVQKPSSFTVDLDVVSAGHSLGSYRYTRRLLPGGGIEERHAHVVKKGSRVINLEETDTYDEKGRLLRAVVASRSGDQSSTTTATVDKGVAKVTIAEKGKANVVKTYKASASPQIGDRTLFWFLRDQPKPGSQVTCQEFVLVEMAWKTLTRTYVGKVPLIVRGKKVMVNKCVDSEMTMYLDEHGMAYKIEVGDLQMLRVGGSRRS